MAQIKIYGAKQHLAVHRDTLSAIIHDVAMDVLNLPETKRFHRFFPLDPADFVHPADRGPSYTILEISMFEGRELETKRRLLERLMAALSSQLSIPIDDIEITIFETPKANWGIRGQTADQLILDYKVET